MKRVGKKRTARSAEGISKKRFLGYEELTFAAKEFAVQAKKEGVKIALLGGYALQFYGSNRLTVDLDFVGERVLQFPFKKDLSFGGQQMVASNGVEVDIIVRTDAYRGLYQDALYHTQKIKGAPTPVVRLEYLIPMKFACGRPKDIADLAFILTETLFDKERAYWLIRKHLGVYAELEFEQLAMEIEWRHSKGLLE